MSLTTQDHHHALDIHADEADLRSAYRGLRNENRTLFLMALCRQAFRPGMAARHEPQRADPPPVEARNPVTQLQAVTKSRRLCALLSQLASAGSARGSFTLKGVRCAAKTAAPPVQAQSQTTSCKVLSKATKLCPANRLACFMPHGRSSSHPIHSPREAGASAGPSRSGRAV